MGHAKSLACVAALALASTSCSPPATEQGAAQETAPNVRSSGEVVVITTAYNAITIRHEAIPEYNMGAMTMEFTVTNPAELTNVSVGDHVTFVLSGPLDIETITVTQPE